MSFTDEGVPRTVGGSARGRSTTLGSESTIGGTGSTGGRGRVKRESGEEHEPIKRIKLER